MYEAQDGCTTLLELTRSEAWCEGNSRIRHQFNGITAFVDGSGVYGSDDETAHSLRGTQGKMLTFDGKLPASTPCSFPKRLVSWLRESHPTSSCI